MNLVPTVLEIVAPVFLLGAVGFLLVRLGFEYRAAFATRMAMAVAIPCLISTSLMEIEIALAALATVSLATAIVYGIVTAIAVLAVRLAGIE